MRRTLLILSVVILSGFLGTRALGQSLKTNAQLALVGGTIYSSPTEDPIRNGVILMDGRQNRGRKRPKCRPIEGD